MNSEGSMAISSHSASGTTEQGTGWVSKDPNICQTRVIARGYSSEVYEMRDNRTSQTFARKIIHIFGTLTIEDVQKEISAIERLQQNGGHKNIVEVLRHGELSYMSLYYIDMELCDLNLEDYITGQRSSIVSIEWQMSPESAKIHIPGPSNLKLAVILSIMNDITDGLAFMHSRKVIHRDLKPANVLYSRRAQAWMIADFGLTTEGTSKQPLITVNANGTPSYRAPELIRGVDFVYTNKVDLWALGCIFYELLFGRKAFAGDYAVREYSASPELLGIPVTSAILGNISSWREAIKAVLHATLDKDPSKRGSAHEIRIHLTALSAVIFTSSKPQNGRTTNNDGIHETMVDESVHDVNTELKRQLAPANVASVHWYWALSLLILLLAMYYFHPSAIRERREVVSPKTPALHDSFQMLNSVEEISAKPPVANTLPLETSSLEAVRPPALISDKLESKRRADAQTVQANFGDDIRPAPPQGNPHLFETESQTPNEQALPKPPVQKPSILRDIIEIYNILWSGFQGLVFGIREHGVAVAVAVAHAYSVTKLMEPPSPEFPYPFVFHPITWVLLALARGASVTGCFAVCLVLCLLFMFLCIIGGTIFEKAFDQNPADHGKTVFAFVMLTGAVILYVEYLGLNCGEGSQSQNASFIQRKVCK